MKQQLKMIGVAMGLIAMGVGLGRAAEDKDWITLFNGKNLSGWQTDAPELWRVEDGVLIGVGRPLAKNKFLYSAKTYGDFDLKYEARLVDDEGNSGVQIRSERQADGHAKGYQVDIGKGYWGSLYHEHGRGMLAHYKIDEGGESDPIKRDEFNLFEVSCRGHHIKIKVNGVTTVDLEDPEGELRGHIALQIHSGRSTEIHFRNIAIRPHGS